jgi:hypothetical protein
MDSYNNLTKKKFNVIKIIQLDGQVFVIFKSKVESTQIANGGSINYPSILIVTLWFQQVLTVAETIQCDYTNTRCF